MVARVVKLAGGYQTIVGVNQSLTSAVKQTASPAYRRPSSSSQSGAARSSGGDTYNTTSYPAFPKAPRAPSVRTIPDPDSRRIQVAEERALARRKKGRQFTILTDRAKNKLN